MRLVDVPQVHPGKLVGRAAVFDVPGVGVDGITTILKPGCFTKALSRSENVVACAMHQEDEAFLGSLYNGTLRLWQDDRGLMAEIILPNNRLGRRIALCVFYGLFRGMSFHGQAMECKLSKDGTRRVVHEVARLVDVGPARPAAFPQTSIRWAPTFGNGR